MGYTAAALDFGRLRPDMRPDPFPSQAIDDEAEPDGPNPCAERPGFRPERRAGSRERRRACAASPTRSPCSRPRSPTSRTSSCARSPTWRTCAAAPSARSRTPAPTPSTNFARDMLNVADNVAAALESVPAEARESADGAFRALIEGIELTERDLLKTLERHGVRKLDPQGQKFDPNLHQAMFEVPNPDVPNGTVVQVVQIRLRHRRARPAPGPGRRRQGRAEGERHQGDGAGDRLDGDGQARRPAAEQPRQGA